MRIKDKKQIGTEFINYKSRHKDNSEIFRKPSIFFQVSWKVAIKISKILGKFVNGGSLHTYFHYPFVNKI
jgi:hypothetical protein